MKELIADFSVQVFGKLGVRGFRYSCTRGSGDVLRHLHHCWAAFRLVRWLCEESACWPATSGAQSAHDIDFIENFLGFGSGPVWVTESFCSYYSGASCCGWSSLEGQSIGAWVGDSSQGAGHWAGTTATHSQKGAWPLACFSRRLEVRAAKLR